MPDYGYGALALGAGAQEGLATLLKQRLMERAQQLAELTQQQTAQQHAAEMAMRGSEVAENRKFREGQFAYNKQQDEAAAADRQAAVLRATDAATLNNLQEQYAPGDLITNPQDQPNAARLMPGLVKLRPTEYGTGPLVDAPWAAEYKGTATQRRQVGADQLSAERAQLSEDRFHQTIANQNRLAAQREERMDNMGWSVQTIQTPEGDFKNVRVNARDGRIEPIDLGGQPATAEQRSRGAAMKRIGPVMQGISDLSEKINTGRGVVARLGGTVEGVKAKANLNDDVSEYNALISGFTPMVARAVGHTGVLTQQDVDSVKALFPNPGDSKSVRDRKINRINQILGAQGMATTESAAPPATTVRKSVSAIKR